MRAIGYARVSKADRRKGKQHEAHSIEAQRQAIRRAAEYNGWELLDVKTDNGKVRLEHSPRRTPSSTHDAQGR